jgi:jumonji domain-containing protein 2
LTVEEFSQMARRVELKDNLDNLNDDDIERKFWKNILWCPPIYGADMPGSLTDKEVEEWNMTKLKTILQLIDVPLAGINSPYLYFGMWKAMFSWHTEDMDLYSINYLHFGKPKRWYSIPSSQGEKFERAAATYFPAMRKDCKAFLRHKTTMINPHVLAKQDGITVNTCVQKVGQFMITFPFAYHSGFNHGFNCAEAVNFAQPDWIHYGQKASRCLCIDGTVSIDMKLFSVRYELFKELGADAIITDEMIYKKLYQSNQYDSEYGVVNTTTTTTTTYNATSTNLPSTTRNNKRNRSSQNNVEKRRTRRKSKENENTLENSHSEEKAEFSMLWLNQPGLLFSCSVKDEHILNINIKRRTN